MRFSSTVATLLFSIMLISLPTLLSGQDASEPSPAQDSPTELDAASGEEATTTEGTAEEDLAFAEVFTPFVSRFQAEVLNDQIRVSWQDIAEAPELKYNVYRSSVEITNDSFESAELIATIDPGVEIFTDTLADNGAYFYAIVTIDQNGEELPIFIPFRNTNVLAAVVSDIPEDFVATAVQNLSARSGEGSIELNFITSGEFDQLLVYRSTSSISNSANLADAILIDRIDGDADSYRDFVLPGIPYFYAVSDSANISSQSPLFIIGENTLSEPVELESGRGFAGISTVPRSIDTLPLLNLERSVISGGTLPRGGIEIPEARELSNETSSVVERLILPISQNPERELLPDVLVTERNAPQERDQNFVLFGIVSESFSLENYELSIRQLESILTLPLESDLENRSRYYYAQSLYFSGEYERAFLQFLLLEDWDFPRVRSWMDDILQKLSDIRRQNQD